MLGLDQHLSGRFLGCVTNCRNTGSYPNSFRRTTAIFFQPNFNPELFECSLAGYIDTLSIDLTYELGQFKCQAWNIWLESGVPRKFLRFFSGAETTRYQKTELHRQYFEEIQNLRFVLKSILSLSLFTHHNERGTHVYGFGCCEIYPSIVKSGLR